MASRFPFPLPRGWFQVAYSSELEPGGVMPLRYFGRELVLFRTESGEAHVLDAFCPHLGAHLGHGGEVTGEILQCPFHGWRFDGSGACVEIPYAEKIPKKSGLECWRLREAGGLIMVWHDAEGGEPDWDVPDIPEATSDDWTDFETRKWSVATCNQEMAENAVDSAHFLYLHGTAGMPKTKAESLGSRLHVLSEIEMTTPGGIVPGTVEVDCWGFGFTTTRFRGLVETLVISSAIAIDHDHCDIRFAFTVKKMGGRSLTDGIGKAFMHEIARQLEQDIPIWENKVYLDRPALCDGDGPIGVFRRWCKQFYPEDFRVRSAA